MHLLNSISTWFIPYIFHSYVPRKKKKDSSTTRSSKYRMQVAVKCFLFSLLTKRDAVVASLQMFPISEHDDTSLGMMEPTNNKTKPF